MNILQSVMGHFETQYLTGCIRSHPMLEKSMIHFSKKMYKIQKRERYSNGKLFEITTETGWTLKKNYNNHGRMFTLRLTPLSKTTILHKITCF